MKANLEKCHFICSSNDTVNLIVENQMIDNSNCEQLLTVKSEYILTFNDHTDGICKKITAEVKCLFKKSTVNGLYQKAVISKFMSQFNYYPLISMCHNLTKNNKITCIKDVLT